jgi:hypothetical protein
MPLTARGRSDFSRRDFHRLATAALGGLIAGTLTGCGDGDRAAPGRPVSSDVQADSKSGNSTPGKSSVAATAVALHACRGLNECKGLGKAHKNACVGQGDCYTVTHECAGQNDCKYLGGCGGTNGFNDCKGKGGCGHFPIQDQVIWKKARAQFEGRMKVAGKKVGSAPAAKS